MLLKSRSSYVPESAGDCACLAKPVLSLRQEDRKSIPNAFTFTIVRCSLEHHQLRAFLSFVESRSNGERSHFTAVSVATAAAGHISQAKYDFGA